MFAVPCAGFLFFHLFWTNKSKTSKKYKKKKIEIAGL